jgi:hypothetical protein
MSLFTTLLTVGIVVSCLIAMMLYIRDRRYQLRSIKPIETYWVGVFAVLIFVVYALSITTMFVGWKLLST